ncbi:MAG: NAD(P)H-dependent glycerol-3-phosphate dehydrogenase [Candidatus Nanoarchaeia archaeon]|nr:NAD(P)H-dependent glycerol-3-phosphate dehydrogenase [Candidatus Nanoarchaeia archaeon]
MKIAILGAGNMATSFATLAPADSKVMLYTIEKEVYENINNNHLNLKYAEIKLENNISSSMNLKECLINSDIVVFSLPSKAVRSVCEEMKNFVSKKSIFIILSKGLDELTNKTMSQMISEYFDNEIVVVGGPSIANELMKKIPTFVVFASKGLTANKCKKIFQKEYYNITISNDVLGVELCSFLKNIYAIYLGIASGLNYGMNTKSALIYNSLNEMTIICKNLGASNKSVYSLAGIGDLIVTSLSNDGRNKRFGELIAQGKSSYEAKEIIGQIIEGENALKILRKIVDEKKISLPIFEKIYNIVFLKGTISI